METLTNPCCSLEQLREQLGDDGGETQPEGNLIRAINATTRGIERWTGRRFWQDPTPVARTYSPEFRDRAWVDDISTTTGLVVETGPGDGTWDTTLSLATDFRLEPRNAATNGPAYAWWRIVAIGGTRLVVSDTLETLRVTSRGGWSEWPDDVVQAGIIRAAAVFKRKESIDGTAGFGEMGIVRISSRRDPDVVELLTPFKRILTA